MSFHSQIPPDSDDISNWAVFSRSCHTWRCRQSTVGRARWCRLCDHGDVAAPSDCILAFGMGRSSWKKARLSLSSGITSSCIIWRRRRSDSFRVWSKATASQRQRFPVSDGTWPWRRRTPTHRSSFSICKRSNDAKFSSPPKRHPRLSTRQGTERRNVLHLTGHRLSQF